MPATISHSLSMTTPNDPAYENQPQHWNQPHAFTINATGSEISNAFSNTNGISFGLSGGAITGSYTVPSVTDYFSKTNTTFNGVNISGSITNNTNGLQLSLSVGAGGAGDGVNILAAGTQTANTTGTVLFVDSNGIAFGMSNNSRITASYTVPSTAGLLSNIRVSAGTTSNLLSDFTLSNANNVSFGINASTITASASFNQTNQSAIKGLGVSNTGQTAGNTGVSTGVDWVLAGSQSITMSQSTAAGGPNTIWVQHPAWLTTAMQSNAVTLSNIRVSAGTTSNLLSAMTFSDSNGLAFGINGSTITGSYTVPTQTNQTVGLYGSSQTTGSASSGTLDARSLSIIGAGIISVGMHSTSVGGTTTGLLISATQSNQAWSGSNASSTFQTLVFANANGASWSNNAGSVQVSYTRNVASNAIQLVGSATGSGTNTSRFAADDHVHAGVFSLGVSTAGNTSGDTRVDVGRFVLQGGNNITLSQVTAANALNTIIVSGGAGGGVNPVASASNGSFSFTTLNFSNANNVTFGTSAGSIITASVAAPGAAAENNWVNLLGANTAGNTTASGSTIGYSGINLTLSGTNGSVVNISAPATSSLVGSQGISISTNGSTISILGPNYASYWQNLPLMGTSAATTSAMQSTSLAIPLAVNEFLSINRMRFVRSVAAGVTSVATVANTSWGFTQSQTHNYVFYSYGTGANSQSLQSFTSTSYGVTMTLLGSNGAASNNLSVNRTIFAPMSTGGSSFTFSTAPAGSASLPFATTDMSNFISGVRLHDSAFAASFPANIFFLVHGVSTNGATGGGTAASALTAATINFQMLLYQGINSNIASFGTSNQSFNLALVNAAGSFTTAGGGTTNSIGNISLFSSIASNPVIYFFMDRIA